jgi:hypothetical protein
MSSSNSHKTKGSTEEDLRVDVDRIKREVSELSVLVEAGIPVRELERKYVSLNRAYPVLFKNIVSRKMSLEEVNLLLNAFADAQEKSFGN